MQAGLAGQALKYLVTQQGGFKAIPLRSLALSLPCGCATNHPFNHNRSHQIFIL